jgi:hypothetical protein
MNTSSSSVSEKTSQRLTDHQTKADTSSSWDNFKRQNGCIKVSDPYYGKRKQSNTVRRIQRKIQLLESKMSPNAEQEIRLSADNAKQDNKSMSLGKSSDIKESKLTVTISEEVKKPNLHQTAPAIKVTDATHELSETRNEDVDTWMTKDELLEIFFRSL